MRFQSLCCRINLCLHQDSGSFLHFFIPSSIAVCNPFQCCPAFRCFCHISQRVPHIPVSYTHLLSEAAVERMKRVGYRSTQSSDSERIARKLLLEGYHLKGVPGFYVNRNGDWETAFYPANSGYLCPVYSAEGMLCGFQIRLDHPKDKRKYVWFTSSGLKGGTSSKRCV